MTTTTDTNPTSPPVADETPQDAPEKPVEADESTTDTEAPDEDSEATEDAPEAPSKNAEAAKYRRQLRATEKERDTLTTRIDTFQRREAERLAADLLADPADLWRDDLTLDTLLDDDGNLDAEKVSKACTSITAAHPHWTRRGPTPKASKMRSGSAASTEHQSRGWADVLNHRES